MDEDDRLRDTLKTRLMAHAEDLVFDGYTADADLNDDQNRLQRREQMFRASTAIAKVFELNPDYPPLQVVRLLNLSQEDLADMVRWRFIEPLIIRHHRNETERAANVDHQTGLGNAAAFSRARKTALEQNAWFIALDFDNFKLVNDTLGHPAGNAALREFAVVLIQTVRQFGMSARSFRVGGDEFIIVVAGRTPKLTAARIVADLQDNLRERLNSPDDFRDAEGNHFSSQSFRQCGMWFSVGVAITPELADAALIRAKKRPIVLPSPRQPRRRASDRPRK